MASQFSLFKQRKFGAMFCTQFLGAFNDNVFKQALILVLTFSAAGKIGVEVSLLTNLAAMLFILPYFLFSALAGQLADKYEKSGLTKKIKLLEIIIMVFAAIGFIFEIYSLLFVALFLMGTHSTFFGPIKYAYLPEVMADDEIVGANGLFQMGTSIAILTGMILAGVLTQLSSPLYWISGVTLGIAILGYASAVFLPKTTMFDPSMKINWNIFSTSFELIKYLWSIPLLFFVIMGNSWFWFYGATLTVQTPEFAKTILHGNEGVTILMLTLFSVGTATGSMLCKTLTKNQVSLKLLPVGILGLTIFAVLLYFKLSNINITPAQGTVYDVSTLIGFDGIWQILLYLFMLGFSGGIYIVPLYALMQAAAPVSHRARVVGVNNIFNAIFMVSSAIFAIVVLNVVKLDIPMLFLITGALNLIFAGFIFLKLSKFKDNLPIHHENDLGV